MYKKLIRLSFFIVGVYCSCTNIIASVYCAVERTDNERGAIALVTGTTSGLGYAASRLLAEEGYSQVIVTGRNLARAQETATQLADQTRKKIFMPLELELDSPANVQLALDELVRRGQPIDFLLLNAGLVPFTDRRVTAAGVESSQAPLIGHHQLTVGLLRAHLLSPTARIVIAGAEPARGDVPFFTYTDVPDFAARHHSGNRTAAIEELVRSGPNVRYLPNNAYADAKVFVAWWTAELARKLPPHMAVYAVSPGGASTTNVTRSASAVLRYILIPIVRCIPGMDQTPETAARRYLQASTFGTDVSGQFFASAPGQVSGPIEAMRHPHLHDHASQEAAWQAIVRISGVDLTEDLVGGGGAVAVAPTRNNSR